MWLDELPVEVCERIFRNLLIEWDASTEIYRNVAALSRVSDKQKEAAKLAVPTHVTHRLSIDKAEEGFNELLAPKLQALSLGRLVCPEDEPLFRAPHLYAVAMHAHNLDALNVIAGCHSLRQLSLFVCEDVSWEEVLECLRTLPLKHLRLEYTKYYEPSNCPCVPFEGSSSGCSMRLEALLSAMPELRSLVVRCEAHTPDYTEQMIQRLLQLPNLTKVNVVSSVPSMYKERLQTLHDIIIDDYTVDQFETALELGPLLTHFFAKHTPLNTEQVTQLKKCKGLKVMSIALEQGAEADLRDLVCALPHLRSMEVFWSTEVIEDDEGFRKRSSYAAFPGAIRRAVEVGKKLIELKICNATLDALELEQILQSLGKRLRSFTLTISYSDLEGFACLQTCLDCILKYNPSLNKIGVKWHGYEVIQPYHATAQHEGPVRKLLETTRRLYVRNMIIRLPYFLIALNGFYRLAFSYYRSFAPNNDGSDYTEEEGAGSDDIAMEE